MQLSEKGHRKPEEFHKKHRWKVDSDSLKRTKLFSFFLLELSVFCETHWFCCDLYLLLSHKRLCFCRHVGKDFNTDRVHILCSMLQGGLRFPVAILSPPVAPLASLCCCQCHWVGGLQLAVMGDASIQHLSLAAWQYSCLPGLPLAVLSHVCALGVISRILPFILAGWLGGTSSVMWCHQAKVFLARHWPIKILEDKKKRAVASVCVAVYEAVPQPGLNLEDFAGMSSIQLQYQADTLLVWLLHPFLVVQFIFSVCNQLGKIDAWYLMRCQEGASVE